jgi:hypothetical protein
VILAGVDLVVLVRVLLLAAGAVVVPVDVLVRVRVAVLRAVRVRVLVAVGVLVGVLVHRKPPDRCSGPNLRASNVLHPSEVEPTRTICVVAE